MLRVPIAAALVGLLAAVAGTTSAQAGQPDDGSRRAHYDDYVALGDSFTSGPLIHPIRLDRPLGCVVSARNYPALLAAQLDVETYTDVSCGGARSSNLWKPQETPLGTNARQLDALSKDTDLVTLGMGGNDFGLFGSLISDCTEVRDQNPTGSPCKNKFTENGVDTKLRDAKRIRGHIARSVRAIHKRAPSAEVAVVGYVRILPPIGTCDAVPFADGDYAWGDKLERRLNKSLRLGAERNGATYINMYPASIGHDACGSGVAWVNGSKIDLLRAMSFHPFAKGMVGIAGETYRQLTGRTAPRVKPFDTGAATAGKREAKRFAELLH
ncbi:SGNH/GDSL hydrolase family protein [Solicola gregarius]|uniref:SGNH/GDSL hydrolase family protein n=1 Tax=Solicola gregarius TaxID=2908642 RepID=A0AA46TG30_9ACTN|nr:SGNH/GDSL hydrolase family protein [Solicola gregarius]UYM04490.1 SGNH/GDSL hydrolase family protein [Solicola gregarius]